MQWLYVLRGCVAAYLFGVAVMAGGNMFFDENGLEAIGIIAIFGAFLLVPFAIVAVIIWAVLAGLGKVVTRGQTAAICAGVFFCVGVLLGIGDGSWIAIVASMVLAPLVGGAFGVVFWFGAFGRRSMVQMGNPPPDGGA